MDSVFSQVNLSPTQGVELLGALGMDAWDLQNPDKYAKYLVVAKYLERFEDGALIARTIGRDTLKGERIDKILEYVNLRRSLDEVRAKKSTLTNLLTDEEERVRVEGEEKVLLNELMQYE